MRKLWLVVVTVLAMAVSAYAGTIAPRLYADTAPNAYGSPNYDPWWTAAKADVAAGTFINMRSGAHPGTTYFEPTEAIVYSTGDLGKRLHWIYWIPGATKSQLNGLFEVNNSWDEDGQEWVWDFSASPFRVPMQDEDNNGIPDNGWYQPSRWEDYSGGVIGTFGNALWASDDEAPPYDTNGRPYDETNDEDVAALASWMLQHQTHWTGWVRYRQSTTDDWTYMQLRLQVVPEPGTVVLWLSGFAAPAFALLRRRK